MALELHPLVVEINRLQRHTEQQLQRSRHALGDLGHALKTPLAILKNRCTHELAASDPELHALLCEQLAQMEANIRRALGRARVAAGVTASNPFSPAQDIPLLLTTLEQAHRRDLDIHLEMAALPAQPFDRDDMLEVLGNVLDNAFKWANRRVRVVVHVVEERCADNEERKQLILCVEDDGPGIQEKIAANRCCNGGSDWMNAQPVTGWGCRSSAIPWRLTVGNWRWMKAPWAGCGLVCIFLIRYENSGNQRELET